MNVTNDTKLTTVKDETLISGFAKLLQDKIIKDGSSWDITIGAVEELDNITDSSIGITFGVICYLDPQPNSLITLDRLENMTKESIIEKNKVANLFALYSLHEKNGTIEKVFKR